MTQANSFEVHDSAILGESVIVRALAMVRENVVIGNRTRIGRGAYLGPGVSVGADVKIQNFAQLFEPASIGDGTFIGPHVVLTNDRYPRAITHEGVQKGEEDWNKAGVIVGSGVSIGASSVCVGPIRIGDWALIGAGSVVTRDVQSFALVVGNPGRRIGWVGVRGIRLISAGANQWVCPIGGDYYLERNGTLVRESL